VNSLALVKVKLTLAWHFTATDPSLVALEAAKAAFLFQVIWASQGFVAMQQVLAVTTAALFQSIPGAGFEPATLPSGWVSLDQMFHLLRHLCRLAGRYSSQLSQMDSAGTPPPGDKLVGFFRSFGNRAFFVRTKSTRFFSSNR